MGVHRHALIVAFLLCVLGCHREKNIAPDPSDRPKSDAAPADDEVAIWSIVVDDVVAPFAHAGTRIPVVDETMQPLCSHDLAPAMPTAKSETLEAFAHVGVEPVRPLRTRAPTTLVGDDVPIGAPSPGFWVLSAVGFDGAHHDALVYVMHVQGAQSRRALAYHLVRDDGGWRKMEVTICL